MAKHFKFCPQSRREGSDRQMDRITEVGLVDKANWDNWPDIRASEIIHVQRGISYPQSPP